LLGDKRSYNKPNSVNYKLSLMHSTDNYVITRAYDFGNLKSVFFPPFVIILSNTTFDTDTTPEYDFYKPSQLYI